MEVLKVPTKKRMKFSLILCQESEKTGNILIFTSVLYSRSELPVQQHHV